MVYGVWYSPERLKKQIKKLKLKPVSYLPNVCVNEVGLYSTVQSFLFRKFKKYIIINNNVPKNKNNIEKLIKRKKLINNF